MYKVTQKLQFYTFFYPLNVFIPSSCSQQCNRLTIFWLAEKNDLKTPIKRSKIKLLYLLAPSLFLLNRANCSACADKFPTCCGGCYFFGWSKAIEYILRIGCRIVAKFNTHILCSMHTFYIQYTHFIFNTLILYSIHTFYIQYTHFIFNTHIEYFRCCIEYLTRLLNVFAKILNIFR